MSKFEALTKQKAESICLESNILLLEYSGKASTKSKVQCLAYGCNKEFERAVGDIKRGRGCPHCKGQGAAPSVTDGAYEKMFKPLEQPSIEEQIDAIEASRAEKGWEPIPQIIKEILTQPVSPPVKVEVSNTGTQPKKPEIPRAIGNKVINDNYGKVPNLDAKPKQSVIPPQVLIPTGIKVMAESAKEATESAYDHYRRIKERLEASRIQAAESERRYKEQHMLYQQIIKEIEEAQAEIRAELSALEMWESMYSNKKTGKIPRLE